MTYLNPKTVPKPAQNSTNNNFMQDVVGNKADSVGVPFVAGNNSIAAHLKTAYYHVHGRPLIYPVYANPVTLTSGSGAWNTGGAIIQVIPTATLTVAAFDLHWINISNISATAYFVIDIYSDTGGGNVWIGAVRGFRTSNFSQEIPKKVQIPQQPAGAKISCKLSDSTAGTITCAVSFEGHYYST